MFPVHLRRAPQHKHTPHSAVTQEWVKAAGKTQADHLRCSSASRRLQVRTKAAAHALHPLLPQCLLGNGSNWAPAPTCQQQPSPASSLVGPSGVGAEPRRLCGCFASPPGRKPSQESPGLLEPPPPPNGDKQQSSGSGESVPVPAACLSRYSSSMIWQRLSSI